MWLPGAGTPGLADLRHSLNFFFFFFFVATVCRKGQASVHFTAWAAEAGQYLKCG